MSEKININLADADTLATLTGIGSELAQRIVAYRELEGAFDDPFELVAVPGISARMVREFEDEVVLERDDPVVEDTAVSSESPVDASEAEESQPPRKPTSESISETIHIAPTEREPAEVATPMTATIPPHNASDTVQLEARAQRRGCFSIIAGAIFGAILGATLTLVLLASLNQGSLEYNAPDVRLQNRLDDEIEQRRTQLETIDTLLGESATREVELEQAIATGSATIHEMEEIIVDTEATVAAMDERVGEVAGAAENFNLFMFGLRDVVEQLALPTTTPTPTGTATSTAVSTNLPTTTTPKSTAVRATRTPRPTATPLFTNTPAPQP